MAAQWHLTADEVLIPAAGRWLGGGRSQGETVRQLAAGNLLVSGLALVADVEDANDRASWPAKTTTRWRLVQCTGSGRIRAVGRQGGSAGVPIRVMGWTPVAWTALLVVKQHVKDGGS